MWQHEYVVKCYQEEYHCANSKRNLPRKRYIVGAGLYYTGYCHQYALSEHRCYAVECAAHAYKCGLAARAVSKHIIAVGGYVVRCRGKCGNDKQHERECEHTDRRCSRCYGCHIRFWQCDGQNHHQRCHKHLHAHYPPTLGLYHVYYRAPQAFQEPWEIEQCGEKRHITVGNAHLGEHHHRYIIYHEIRYAFCKI